MKVYSVVRDWVDRQWQAGGLQWKVLLAPVIIPLAVAGAIIRDPYVFLAGLIWFALWTGFVSWRFWFYLKDVSREGDETYDRTGKFQLSREYHDTESATASAKRRRRR